MITQKDLTQLEKFADKLFAKVGIDVEFTRHFLDRVNDSRNKKQITSSELTRLFKQTFKLHGKKIAKLGPDAQAVIQDMKTDVNMPFVLNWDERSQELDLVAKTVMRKKGFKTSNKTFAIKENGKMVTKKYSQFITEAKKKVEKNGEKFKLSGKKQEIIVNPDMDDTMNDSCDSDTKLVHKTK